MEMVSLCGAKFISLYRVTTIPLGLSILMGLLSLPLVTPVGAQEFSPFPDFRNMSLPEFNTLQVKLTNGAQPLINAGRSDIDRRVTGGPFEGTRVRDDQIEIKYTSDANASGCEKIVFIQVIKRTGTKAGPDGKLDTSDDVKVPLKPSDFENFEGARRLDDWTIKEEGISVDRLPDATEPYYGGGTSRKPSILENGDTGGEHSGQRW